jgi:hypothetical protein
MQHSSHSCNRPQLRSCHETAAVVQLYVQVPELLLPDTAGNPYTWSSGHQVRIETQLVPFVGRK